MPGGTGTARPPPPRERDLVRGVAAPAADRNGVQKAGSTPSSPWKRRATGRMVGVVGFEPTTSCSQSTCATTALHPGRFRAHEAHDAPRATPERLAYSARTARCSSAGTGPTRSSTAMPAGPTALAPRAAPGRRWDTWVPCRYLYGMTSLALDSAAIATTVERAIAGDEAPSPGSSAPTTATWSGSPTSSAATRGSPRTPRRRPGRSPGASSPRSATPSASGPGSCPSPRTRPASSCGAEHRRGVVEIRVDARRSAGADPSAAIDRLDLANALRHLKPEDRGAARPALRRRTSTRPRSAPVLGMSAVGRAGPPLPPRSTASGRSSAMAELDAFERRVADALPRLRRERLVGGRPGGLAHRVAAASTRRHGSAVARLWRVRRDPARSPGSCSCWRACSPRWSAGCSSSARSRQPRLPAVVPPVGQVFDCPPGSTPDEPGPVDQARPAEPGSRWPSTAARQAGGRRGPIRRRVETWTFDVCTNTWTRMHPEPGAAALRLARPARLRRRLRRDDRDPRHREGVGLRPPGRHLDREGLGLAPAAARAPGLRPGLRPRRRRGHDDPNPSELWNYDVETDTWTPIHQANGPRPTAGCSPTTPPSTGWSRTRTGRSAPEPETWLFDIRTGTWSRSARRDAGRRRRGGGAPPSPTTRRRSGRWSSSNARVAAYDATADRWEILVRREPGVDDGHDGVRPGERAARRPRSRSQRRGRPAGSGRRGRLRSRDPRVDRPARRGRRAARAVRGAGRNHRIGRRPEGAER